MEKMVGFIGVGNMGGALLESLAKGDESIRFIANDLNKTRLEQLKKNYGIRVADDVNKVVSLSDYIILAVKPQHCDSVLDSIKGVFDSMVSRKKILISIVAGLPISYFKSILGPDAKIIRTMPNTPAMVGEGMTILCYDDLITDEEKEFVKKLFSYAGLVEELNENLMNQVIALTGSSPAYVFMLIEAMADAAVQSGIPRNLSYRLAAQTVLGSAKMVLETGKHPGELKDMVCSPAGTTIEAVAAIEREGFRNAIITAMGECTRRAKEIGKRNREKK